MRFNVLIRRLVASFVDIGLLYAGWHFYEYMLTKDQPMAYDRLFAGVFELLSYVPFCLLYTPLSESLSRGQTIGKYLLGLRVVSSQHGGFGLKEAFLRWLGGWVDFYITLGIAAGISMLQSRPYQRLGDRLARTWVVREFRPQERIKLPSPHFNFRVRDDYVEKGKIYEYREAGRRYKIQCLGVWMDASLIYVRLLVLESDPKPYSLQVGEILEVSINTSGIVFPGMWYLREL
ncbi:RDD family protein [Runella sp. MFBS21]|uniref:RDD family protein n=1 Tax=Runella sp. MFBS21 TaxID=3034018 RepID=UPI0023F71B22|nr:RDD family protein [Runella sp. MFBS21]MDF7821836.1 RDD family protein [Runella sp. MFBS21]